VLRGWLPFYATGVRLGLRGVARGRFDRQTVLRVAAPMEDTRLFELPATVKALRAAPGEHVLDLASPKLAAVQLAKAGVRVTSVDLFEEEVETWRSLAAGVANLDFQVADGRDLPFESGAFDHAYSISVIEHIGDDGDLRALAELARVVRRGGRVVITVPYAAEFSEDWRDAPLYGEQTSQADGRWFFSRTYDDARLDRLLSAAPELSCVTRRPVRFGMNAIYRAYYRGHPWTLPLNAVLGLTLSVVEEAGGLMFLELVRDGHEPPDVPAT
jgi:SAM-dependent methyltransferase